MDAVIPHELRRQRRSHHARCPCPAECFGDTLSAMHVLHSHALPSTIGLLILVACGLCCRS